MDQSPLEIDSRSTGNKMSSLFLKSRFLLTSFFYLFSRLHLLLRVFKLYSILVYLAVELNFIGFLTVLSKI